MIKSLLHMPRTWFDLQKNAEFRPYYERKLAEGNAGMSVLNAVRNKMIKRIFGCVRDNRLYTKEKEVNKLVI